MRVVYSRLGEKADTLIRKIITREKKEWIVITSDREVADRAWASGSVPVPSEEFLPRMVQAAQRPGGLYEPLDEEEDDAPRRGNPRQPSKKEKALIRVLRKL
jgi:predicted RNA-binding protein with PIN domain